MKKIINSNFKNNQVVSDLLKKRPRNYMLDLNDQQIKAVKNVFGPLLVLAGAGTGKTKALTSRIAFILDENFAFPNQILAVTFTNKAAKEMKNRISLNIKNVVEGMPWIGTFHSLSVKILRKHSEYVGLKNNFSILDTEDQIRIIKQVLKIENIDEKRYSPRSFLSLIDRWKNRAIRPEKVSEEEKGFMEGSATKVYSIYQNRLKSLNAVDFGDLLLHVVEILRNNDQILKEYQNKFKFILVDEYQDTNVAQYLWLRLLSGDKKNICCVGDDDQSIYGWRGAEVGNILRFEKDFPDAKIIKLEQNYRSTFHIIETASNLIASNKSRLGKKLWTSETDGEKVKIISHWDGNEEAIWIAEAVKNFVQYNDETCSLNNQAILVRASFQMRAFEDRFLSTGIPYRVVGGPRFYERQEIKDAISYLKIVVSSDNDIAFERIINKPKRGIGEKALQKLYSLSSQKGLSLYNSAKLSSNEKIFNTKSQESLKKLIDNIEIWKKIYIENSKNHIELTQIILDESGYSSMWKNDLSPDSPGRLENLKELVKALEEFDNLDDFLEHISLILDNEKSEENDKISIMTLHAAKGLEFNCVFLPGWEDGLFPSQRSMDELGKIGLEEERRLAYVGITRAKKNCVISFASNRRIYNQWQSCYPSRFFDDLLQQHTEVLTQTDPMSNYKDYRNLDYDNNDLRYDLKNQNLENNTTQKNLSNYKYIHKEKNKGTVTKLENYSLNEIKEFKKGEKIFHQKFGYGFILEIEGENALIDFKKAGQKKVKTNYLFNENEI